MYDKNQFQDASFIDDAEILGTLEQAKKLAADKGAVRELISRRRASATASTTARRRCSSK